MFALIHHVHIFRHGETDWNREGRFQGHIDVPLNETGRTQAAALAEPLRARGVQAILSSDLSRARETGGIAAARLGIPVHVDAGLREAHLGRAQGLRHDEIEAAFGADLARRWRSYLPSDADVSYPDGESGTAVADRAFRAIEDFLRRHPALERIGVATHGGVIRRVMHRILPPGSDPVPIPNGMLYSLAYRPLDGRWTCELPIGGTP